MRVERWMLTLLVLLVADVALMAAAAATGRLRLVALAAAAFAAALSAVAIASNRPRVPAGVMGESDAIPALVGNVRLAAVAWLWGAAAMQAVYFTPVTGLKWQHAWQYATAMLLLSALSYGYAHLLAKQGEKARFAGLRLVDLAPQLATLQAIGGAVGALFLVASGKLITWRPDWAANQIFLFGALLLMVLGAITLHTHRRLQ